MPVRPVGVDDEFCSFGTNEYVARTHGLTTDAVVAARRDVLAAKRARWRGVTGVDHFGVTVSDVDRSLMFWRGSARHDRGRTRGDGMGAPRPIGRALAGTKIEWVELGIARWREGRALSIPPARRRSPVAPGEENEPGRSHISLLVDDLAAMLATLCADGVRSRTDVPVDIPVGAYAGGKAAYVFDPDGVEIELIQRREG